MPAPTDLGDVTSRGANACGPQSPHWSFPLEFRRARTSSSDGIGGADLTPRSKRKVRPRIQRPAANRVLTTAVDPRGRSWTPRCPSRSSGLIRRTAVDSRGRGRSPEKPSRRGGRAAPRIWRGAAGCRMAQVAAALWCGSWPGWLIALCGAAGGWDDGRGLPVTPVPLGMRAR
jgi:hypothetical protein